MKRLIFLKLLFLVTLKISAQQTLTIKAGANGTPAITPETITDPNKAIKLVIDQSVVITGRPVLLHSKNNNTLNINPSAASNNPYNFDAFTGGRKNPDSLFIEIVTNNQPRSFRIFAKAAPVVVTPTPGGGAPHIAGAAPPPTIERLAPGNLIYDALRLADKSTLTLEEQIFRINHYYGSTSKQALAQNDPNNLFLKEYLASVNVAGAQGLGSVSTVFKSLLSSAGGLDVTNIADGLAKFLVKRAKQELSISFFTKFKEEMEEDRYKDLRLLFPATYTVLKRIDKDIYMFDAFKLALIEAFEKDLKNILVHLPNVIEQGTFKNWFDAHKEIKAIVLSGLYIYNSLADGKHPGKVIEDYPVSYLAGINNETFFKGTIQTVQQVSYALRSTTSDHYWASVDTLELLLKNHDAVSAFMALLYIRSEGVVYSATDSLRGFINKLQQARAVEFPAYKNFFIETANRARTIEATLKNLKEKKNSLGAGFVYEDYYGLVDQVFDFTDFFVTNLVSLPHLNGLGFDAQKVIHIVNIGRTINQIGLDVATRNYASGIVNLTNLYDTLTLKVTTPPSPANKTAEIETNKNDLVRKILRYGTLIAGVATAENSDDVEKAIEAVALPSGSARIKRESVCNIALNAYVGLFAGHESLEDGNNKVMINSYGVTAPVGISFAWGSRANKEAKTRKCKSRIKTVGGKSNGIFLSLIDIGAITALRFGDSTTTKLPTIQLKNIVSPGIFYSLGFGKCPLSMNLGVQYGAGLRKVSATTATLSEKDYVRFSVSLLVDIPLLNFYNKN